MITNLIVLIAFSSRKFREKKIVLPITNLIDKIVNQPVKVIFYIYPSRYVYNVVTHMGNWQKYNWWKNTGCTFVNVYFVGVFFCLRVCLYPEVY